MAIPVNYYKWFQSVIDFFIALFFICSLVSNLFVYISVFSGWIKYLLFVVIAAVFVLAVFFLKKPLRKLIERLLTLLSECSFRKLLVLLLFSSAVLKVISYAFFFFDSTKAGGDITIYASLAEGIVENGLSSIADQIYYLAGMGIHLSLFRYLSIPYHLGIYLVFLLATAVNFYSFSKRIGKEKSFLLIELYLLMPSTSLLTFCITHELFVYLYFSLILLLLNAFLEKQDRRSCLLYAALLFAAVSLNQTVSPIGKIWYIVLFLIVLLADLHWSKKGMLVIVLAASLFCTNLLSTGLEGNTPSQSNNIEQLLIGSNLESMGRHTDGRGKQAAKAYWEARGVKLTYENLVEGEKGALIETYKYLLTHPLKLMELLANKFYVAWSGDFYSVEYGHVMGSIGDMMYYVMLLLGSLIWLLTVSIGIVYYKKRDDSIGIYNYKLILLGIMGVLLITEIMNKYSCYMTVFIFFIAFSRTDLCEGDRNG
ncbi:MAG: hypothetical protein IJF87_07625 [Erysipelotrichaceae bacterium]|nr:hypothetical protein [Erysipelotrichaceae bacterium]